MKSAGASPPAVRISDLLFRYTGGPFAFEVDHLEVADGEAVACIGPSGSGKTTLLHLCAGILVAEAGEVVTDGVDWRALSEGARRRARIQRVGLVFQEFELFAHLTVLENILLPYLVHPALELDAAARSRAEELAQAAGLGSHLGRRPGVLSQGERQRAAVCRALVTRPRVVLADEPTGNLDPDTARTVVDLVLRTARASGATVLFVTHDHGLLGAFDRTVDLCALKAGAATDGGEAP